MRTAVEDTVTYIKILARSLGACDVSCAVLVILFDLGIPTNYDGFEYLKEAVLMRYADPTRTVANDIYPAISLKYGNCMSNEQIETAIRGAIEIAWNYTDVSVWRKYFPTTLARKTKRPTNTEFIYELARIVELWSGCAVAYERARRGQEVSYGA